MGGGVAAYGSALGCAAEVAAAFTSCALGLERHPPAKAGTLGEEGTYTSTGLNGSEAFIRIQKDANTEGGHGHTVLWCLWNPLGTGSHPDVSGKVGADLCVLSPPVRLRLLVFHLIEERIGNGYLVRPVKDRPPCADEPPKRVPFSGKKARALRISIKAITTGLLDLPQALSPVQYANPPPPLPLS